MLIFVLDAIGGYLVAKYVKNIWLAILAAIIAGLSNCLITALVLYITFTKSNLVDTSEAQIAVIFGAILNIFIHPILTFFWMLIFRRKRKKTIAKATGSKTSTRVTSNKKPTEAISLSQHIESTSSKNETVENVYETGLDTKVTADIKEIPEDQLDKFYEKAFVEYEKGETIKSLHSRSIVVADGDKSKERATYIKLRVEQLTRERETAMQKKEDNETKNIEENFNPTSTNPNKNKTHQPRKLGVGEGSHTYKSYKSKRDSTYADLQKLWKSDEEKAFNIIKKCSDVVFARISYDVFLNINRNVLGTIFTSMDNIELKEKIGARKTNLGAEASAILFSVALNRGLPIDNLLDLKRLNSLLNHS